MRRICLIQTLPSIDGAVTSCPFDDIRDRIPAAEYEHLINAYTARLLAYENRPIRLHHSLQQFTEVVNAKCASRNLLIVPGAILRSTTFCGLRLLLERIFFSDSHSKKNLFYGNGLYIEDTTEVPAKLADGIRESVTADRFADVQSLLKLTDQTSDYARRIEEIQARNQKFFRPVLTVRTCLAPVLDPELEEQCLLAHERPKSDVVAFEMPRSKTLVYPWFLAGKRAMRFPTSIWSVLFSVAIAAVKRKLQRRMEDKYDSLVAGADADPRNPIDRRTSLHRKWIIVHSYLQILVAWSASLFLLGQSMGWLFACIYAWWAGYLFYRQCGGVATVPLFGSARHQLRVLFSLSSTLYATMDLAAIFALAIVTAIGAKMGRYGHSLELRFLVAALLVILLHGLSCLLICRPAFRLYMNRRFREDPSILDISTVLATSGTGGAAVARQGMGDGSKRIPASATAAATAPVPAQQQPARGIHGSKSARQSRR